ncbi:hypothetical protein RFI_34560, partial [Reticulomyxa filosa]
KSRKIRREYFCNKLPTLVITPVNGILFKSQTSVLKLFGQYGKNIKAHIFSTTWRTMYRLKCSKRLLWHSIKNNNQLWKTQKKQHRIMLCSVFSSNYVKSQKEKRLHDVKNPDVNIYVLLKNRGKSIAFKDLPMVKVLFANSQDVRQLLQTGSIQIGFEHASCEPFDYNRNRPKSHFRQCRKCFGLNHYANECTRKQKCKELLHKRKQSKYKCILCHGKHTSDSVLCHVIQKVRKDIGVNLSRKEKLFILKKEQKGNPTENKTGQKTNNIQILSKNKESESTRKVDAPKFDQQDKQKPKSESKQTERQ